MNYVIFIVLYCDTGAQIIFNTVILALRFIVYLPLFFNSEQEFMTKDLIVLVLVVIVYFIICSLTAMIISYIQELGLKLKNTNEENVKLLDNMHEGLLILSK